jgi:hypothetical protein
LWVFRHEESLHKSMWLSLTRHFNAVKKKT